MVLKKIRWFNLSFNDVHGGFLSSYNTFRTFIEIYFIFYRLNQVNSPSCFTPIDICSLYFWYEHPNTLWPPSNVPTCDHICLLSKLMYLTRMLFPALTGTFLCFFQVGLTMSSAMFIIYTF